MQTKQAPGYFLLCLILIFAVSFSYAQDSTAAFKKPHKRFEASSAIMIAPNYCAQFPFGHVSQRFGFDNLFGLELLYKTNKNWLIGANGGFIYGTKSKQNYVFSTIATSTGQFITQYNDLTSIRPEEHGFNVQFTFGKIVPFSEKYPDAGLLFLTGVGMVQDKIAVSIKAAELPQLSPTYRKGYDRLCNGPVISQFIGGEFMARRKFISGYAGLQVDLSYTENRRPYDFYAMSKLNDKGIDVFIGLKLAWVIPVFLQTSDKEFFYY